MKRLINKAKSRVTIPLLFIVCMLGLNNLLSAQDSATTDAPEAPVKIKPVKNTFSGI